MNPLLIRGRLGLGDNVYQRAIVRELVASADVYLETPWPQLYGDLPIKCVKRPTTLRTQAKNAARKVDRWYAPPAGTVPVVAGYAGRVGTILAGFCESLGVNPSEVVFDLPGFPRATRKRPYVLVRPATIRKEWQAAARNPIPDYLAIAARAARERYEVISVADLSPGVEWPLEPLPEADVTYHKGELVVEELMALVAGAAGVIGGVGWLAPVACAYHVPLLLIYGGCGVHDGPAHIFDPRMPTRNVTHAIPDAFCLCSDRRHACDKRISGIDAIVRQWVVGLHTRHPATVAA